MEAPTASPAESTIGKVRNVVIGALFDLTVATPKFLRVHRDEGSWLVFRIALGVAGAALVILPLSIWNSWLAAPFGLSMFFIAILLPPAKPDKSVEEMARKLGALAVVDGGKYQPGNAPATAVRLFIGPEHIWACNSHLEPIVVIPSAQISNVAVEHSGKDWLMQIEWAEHAAEFFYRGIFAQRLAYIAESAVREVMRPSMPVRPRSRAAGA
jgi:hypothetical protein